MIKAPIDLQDLRRKLYVKAKTEPSWRFWGLYVHVCKLEMLYEAYWLAKANDGAPGVDGMTFEAIEADGLAGFIDQLRQDCKIKCVNTLFEEMKNNKRRNRDECSFRSRRSTNAEEFRSVSQ